MSLTTEVCRFIADHRDRFGVAPICRVLTGHGVKIGPRTFHAWATRAPSKRSLWDATITEVLAGYYEPDEHGRRPRHPDRPDGRRRPEDVAVTALWPAVLEVVEEGSTDREPRAGKPSNARPCARGPRGDPVSSRCRPR